MSSSIFRSSLRVANIPRWPLALYRSCSARIPKTSFHTTSSRKAIKPYLLADIGEGITECRVVQWFVKPGDRVSQFDTICEVQSDKASVEITSRYDGVITSIHHEADEMAAVGKPLLDIDVDNDPSNPDPPAAENASENTSPRTEHFEATPTVKTTPQISFNTGDTKTKNSGLIVPAVRHMLKHHDIDIKDVEGTGKGGRVLKEDVQSYLTSRVSSAPVLPSAPTTQHAPARDKVVLLTPTEMQMFRVMTQALSIPHLGYTHAVDFTALSSLRRKSNEQMEASAEMYGDTISKLTPLPFIMKALSQAFLQHPKLNAHLDTETNPQKAQLLMRSSHNFGIAVDTPNGLLVPVVKDVQSRSILSISAEVKRLSILAKEGRLSPSDMQRATFTVSNIGSIGGSVVSPIILPPTVAIVAVGKVEDVPVFLERNNERGEASIVKRKKAVLSWSADHRVLDGASVARCAELVGKILENIEAIGLALR